jgi:hypothetical protein
MQHVACVDERGADDDIACNAQVDAQAWRWERPQCGPPTAASKCEAESSWGSTSEAPIASSAYERTSLLQYCRSVCDRSNRSAQSAWPFTMATTPVGSSDG